MNPLPNPSSRRCAFLSVADVLFILFTLAIMQHAHRGMMDDPGLGWHLRLPDLMVEQGGFVYDEHFSFPTAGNRWVTRAWLSDILLRGGYAWGGLNAVALMTCMVFAVTLRGIYRRLTSEGIVSGIAVVATMVVALGLIPSFVARPNVISFLGVWLVADLCQRFHRSGITHQKLWWLVPIMLLWANMHGGFLAGLILIGIAWAVEASLSVAAWRAADRQAARLRLKWLTLIGFVAGLATCVNPNGIGLHLWNLQALNDPFIQRQTTTEWRPPDFSESGWFYIERLILLLPFLAATTRRRVNLVGLAMTVVFLHFALIGRRYTTMWVVIAAPTIFELAVHNTWLRQLMRRSRQFMSEDMKRMLNHRRPTTHRAIVSWAAAGIFLFISPWLPVWARHDQATLPTDSLNRFMSINNGEPTFHSANWGGYLTWHGWDNPHRFLTWIDDRIEVHGQDHLKEYLRVLDAKADWQTALDNRQVQWVCIPADARLAEELAKQESMWEHAFTDEHVAVFKRRSSSEEIAVNASTSSPETLPTVLSQALTH